MSEKKPIFQHIKENLTESGTLPGGYYLPSESEDGKPKFVDGAMDGISIYHMGFSPLGDEDSAKLGSLIRLAADGKVNEAEEGFMLFCKENRAVKIIDALQGYIMEHKAELSPGNMHEFATKMMVESTYAECVKIGMSILELFNTFDDAELADAIRTIGVCDEFTIFSVFLMRSWPNGNKEILEMAKKVRGWGRIHCVDFIEPETEEIKEWLLQNGVDNDIVPAYSGYRVFEKAGVDDLIEREDLTKEQMSSILKVVSAMLDEGPVSGISNLDDPEAFLKKVLQKAEGFSFDEDDASALGDIKEWIERA